MLQVNSPLQLRRGHNRFDNPPQLEPPLRGLSSDVPAVSKGLNRKIWSGYLNLVDTPCREPDYLAMLSTTADEMFL